MFRVQEFYDSGTDAAAGAAAGAAATAAASAAAFVFTTVFTVVATVAAAEAAAVAAVAAAPAAASVSEEKNSWTLNIIRFLVFVTLFLHGGVCRHAGSLEEQPAVFGVPEGQLPLSLVKSIGLSCKDRAPKGQLIIGVSK